MRSWNTKVDYRRSGIEDQGDLLELLYNGASHNRGEEVHLGVEFLPHYRALVSIISSDTKELRTYFIMTGPKTTAEYQLIVRYFMELGFQDGN
jgi:hypothetical protein